MKITRISLLVAVLATAGLWSARAVLAAGETPLEFVHALSDSGYADIAIDYLNDLKKENRLPPDVAEVMDLELSKCLRKAANNAYKPEEKEELLKQSKEHLDTFLKEKPNNPEALSAMVWWAGFITDKAMEYMRATKDPALLKEPDKGKEKKAQLLASAREALKEAEPKFADAAEKFRVKMASLKPGHEHDDIEGRWQEARFQAILCNYYIAQTYEDRNAPERQAILEKAAAQFDAIFQVNRETVMGLFAHMWQGKVALDMGNMELAKDIFDEVLANVPEPGSGNSRENRLAPGMDALFAQVQQFRFEITAKESPKDFVKEAREWLVKYKPLFGKTDGYQAISLELVKVLLAGAEKATDSSLKVRLKAEAQKLLLEVSRIIGPYQAEANGLLKTLRGGTSSSGEPTTFAEAIDRATDAALASKWDEAIKWYDKALDLVKKLPPRERKKAEESAKEDLGKIYYAKAHQQFRKNDLTACLETLRTLVTEYRKSSSAPLGAALAVNARWNQYLAVKQDDVKGRETAFKQTEKMATFTINNWPGKPEADDARMLLGLLYLFNNKVDDALKQFDQVNPKADRYTKALYLSGQTYWNRYSQAKQGEIKRDKKLVAADRQKALESFSKCVDLLRRAFSSGPMPKELKDAMLALAEINLEGNDGKASAPLFQQLVDDVQKSKPDKLDKQTQRIFLGAVRAYLMINDLDKAGKAGMVLMDLGPDTEAVNAELLKFAKLVDQERKKAEAELIAAVGPAETEAKGHLAAMKEMLGKLLMKLASREQVSAAGMVWIATTCSAIDLDDAAEKLCQRYIERVKKDAEFAAHGGKQGQTRVRTLLISILRNKEKYEEAYNQIQLIIKEHPRALEPKEEEIHILLDWGAKEPAKFNEAITKCDVLRRSMEKMKPRPPEYYQVSYFEASCIFNLAKRLDKQGNKRDSGDMAHQGQQLLKSILYNNPSLDPELKAKYNKLVDQFDLLQGRKPTPSKKPGGQK